MIEWGQESTWSKTGNILVVKQAYRKNQTQWANKLNGKKAELPIQLVTGWMMMIMTTMTMDRERKSNNTDKNQKRKKSYKTLIGDLTQYTRDCLFPGESPVFHPPPPIHVVVGPILRKRTKKEKKRKRARFTWCSSVCIALAVWYVWNYTGCADSCIAASAPASADGERYIYIHICEWVSECSEWVRVSRRWRCRTESEHFL